ncbi:MAG TPA: LLM class flavin-dependent oxidoreductase [Stellaceae bacterium]|nr:LLM class flavin-dependent oxidoreductase [Stellaceae bacterium]
MMKLGLFVSGPGHHVAAWRDPDVEPDSSQSLKHYIEIARLGEHGRFDFLFNADSNSTFGPDDVNVWKRTIASLRLEPLTLMSALAAVTTHIGLVSTATTTYLEPFHVARLFASLDQLSGGRAGWNLVTSSAASEALNFSHDAHVPHSERYARAAEFLHVVNGLWDTWEDDAFVLDKAEGLFFDPAKLHMLNHKGDHFAVRGPLMIRRSPQGRPVVVQAGQSEAGRALAAATAEVIFTVQQELGTAQDFYADIKKRAAALGRKPEHVLVMPGVMVIVGDTKRDAEAKYEKLQALIHPELGVATLSDMVGLDLSGYPLDGPLPEVPLSNTQQGRQRVVVDLARREGLTIRQLYQRVSGARAHRSIYGTATEIADSLELWYRSGAADGFNIMSLTFPEGLRDFVDHVVPELQRRGLFRTEYEGKTLRENLGLPRPPNAFAASA